MWNVSNSKPTNLNSRDNAPVTLIYINDDQQMTGLRYDNWKLASWSRGNRRPCACGPSLSLPYGRRRHTTYGPIHTSGPTSPRTRTTTGSSTISSCWAPGGSPPQRGCETGPIHYEAARLGGTALGSRSGPKDEPTDNCGSSPPRSTGCSRRRWTAGTAAVTARSPGRPASASGHRPSGRPG